MSKHTPGPWEVFFDASDCEYPGIDHSNGSVILYGSAHDGGGVRGDKQEERLANARLIAAAPEMLEAIEEVSEAFDDGEVDSHIIEIVRAAIKAAKGGA